MATQVGMGLSKVILLVGAGFTGSIMLRNGKLYDILAELQTLVKGMEKAGEDSGADSDYSDALAAQVRRLAMEVRQLASAHPITVLNGNSGQGNATALIVPAATLGALGYGYMWWKATKRHLTQQIENLDGKLDEQKEISAEIKNEVTDARGKLSNIGYELNSLQQLVWGLNFTCAGVMYLCQFVGDKEGKMADFLKDGAKPTGRRGFLGSAETRSLKGLQHNAEAIESGNFDKSKTEAIFQDDINSLDNTKTLSRAASIKC